MAESLKDQLLKLGLVDAKRVQKAKQEQRKEQKKPDNATAAARAQAQAAAAAKAERDKQLNRERQEAAERKARVAQIKQLVDAHQLPKGDGDTAYNFVDGSKIKRLYVKDAVHKQLTAGTAVIAKVHGQYFAVPAEIAERIRQIDATAVIARSDESTQATSEDDPYAKYAVPDDLMW